MSKNKKERRVKVGWVFLVILQLVFDAISRIIVGMDFINPERFLIEGIEPKGKAHE
jgi:hypothetical protein